MSYEIHYYDLVLAGILASLLLGVGLGLATALPLAGTVPVLALVAVAIIGHGLFVNGPVDGPADLSREVDILD